jgi:hypothetical protein
MDYTIRNIVCGKLLWFYYDIHKYKLNIFHEDYHWFKGYVLKWL